MPRSPTNEEVQTAVRIGLGALLACAGLSAALRRDAHAPAVGLERLRALIANEGERGPAAVPLAEIRSAGDDARRIALEGWLRFLADRATSAEPDALRARAAWLVVQGELARADGLAGSAGSTGPVGSPLPTEAWTAELRALARAGAAGAPLDWLAEPEPYLNVWTALETFASEPNGLDAVELADLVEPLDAWRRRAGGELGGRLLFESARVLRWAGRAADAKARLAALAEADPGSSWAAAAEVERADALTVGQAAPALTLADVDGNEVSLSVAPPGAVLVAFVGRPGSTAVPRLVHAARGLAARGVRVVLVTAGGSIERWRRATEDAVNVLDLVAGSAAASSAPSGPRAAWSIGPGETFVVLGPEERVIAATPSLASALDALAGRTARSSRGSVR